MSLSLGRDQLEWSVRYRHLLYISEVFADSVHGVCVGAEFCLGASFNCIRHKIVRSRKVGVAVAFDPFLGALCYERRMGRCYYDSIDECLRGIWAWLLVWIHDCAGIVGGELCIGRVVGVVSYIVPRVVQVAPSDGVSIREWVSLI